MSDEVETMFYAADRGMPWHGKGFALETAVSSKEAYVASGLNWEVKIGPLHDHLQRPIPNRVTIYRATDDKVLGDATDIYTPIQNQVLFDIGDAYFKDGAAKYDTGGSLREGKEVFLLLLLPHTIMVNGTDKHLPYLLLRSGHDGNTSFGGWLTRIRAVCYNTVNEAMQGKAAFRIEHYGDVNKRLVEAGKKIRITTEADKRFELWLNQMAATNVQPLMVEKIEKALFGDLEEVTSMAKNQAGLWRKILAAETEQFGWNQYSFFNSITGMADHGLSVRKRPDGDERMVATYDGLIQNWKARGVKVLEEVIQLPKQPSVSAVASDMGF